MGDSYPTRSANALQERRRHERLKAAVQVEFRAEGALAPTRMATSDISAGGCYIEMNFTLAVGTKLDMVLWLGDQKLVTKAVVATHHPHFGNGIQFVEMPRDAHEQLGCFLASLDL